MPAKGIDNTVPRDSRQIARYSCMIVLLIESILVRPHKKAHSVRLAWLLGYKVVLFALVEEDSIALLSFGLSLSDLLDTAKVYRSIAF